MSIFYNGRQYSVKKLSDFFESFCPAGPMFGIILREIRAKDYCQLALLPSSKDFMKFSDRFHSPEDVRDFFIYCYQEKIKQLTVGDRYYICIYDDNIVYEIFEHQELINDK